MIPSFQPDACFRSLRIPRGWAAYTAVAVCIGGCARYQPHPFTPEASLSHFQERRLGDESLRPELLKGTLKTPGAWPVREWELPQLTVVALKWHPELEAQRRSVGVATAAVPGAGARPNPTLTLAPGNGFPAGLSPWILGFGFDIPIETAGKRALRVADAELGVRIATLSLADAAWRVRSGVRTALAGWSFAERQLRLLDQEVVARQEQVDLLERRLAVGEISQPEVDLARTELMRIRLSRTAARGTIEEARVRLATALGMSVGGLTGAQLSWPDFEHPADLGGLTAATAQREALLHRADFLKALAEYDASEIALRTEVAKQYPDVHLNPGYNWDQGVNKFTFGISANLPIFNRNQGPIAVAEARRREAESKVLALQAATLGEVEMGLARVQSAIQALRASEASLKELGERQIRLAQRAVELGESDRLVLAGAEIQAAVLARARLDSILQTQLAVGAVEDALQRPVPSEDFLNPTVPVFNDHE
jgi:outer membrane protein TolC